MVIGWWEFWLGAFSWGRNWWAVVVGVVVGGFLDGWRFLFVGVVGARYWFW